MNTDLELQLLASCRRGDLPRTRQLVEDLHVNVNIDGDERYTPLHCAVVSGHLHIVRYLLSKGAQIKVTRRIDLGKKEIDETPLTMARKLERFEIARELVQPKSIHTSQLQVFEQPPLSDNNQNTEIDAKMGMCSICTEDSIELCSLTFCGHSFCADCLTGWFTEQLRDGNHFNRCPSTDCRQIVSYSDTIRFVLDQRVNSWFESHCVDAVIDSFDDTRRCPQCGVAGFVVHSDCTQVTCSACSFVFCAQCLDEDHLSMSCKKKANVTYTVEQRQRLEDYSADWISEHAKPCPQCKAAIEHGGACSHMTCKRCSFAFCFVCLGPYQPGKYVYNMKGPCTCVKPQSSAS